MLHMRKPSKEIEQAELNEDSILSIPCVEEEELKVEDFDTESDFSEYNNQQHKNQKNFLPAKTQEPVTFKLILTPTSG